MWQGVTKSKRTQLQQPTARPFTAKEGIRLRGLTEQLSQPNFLHELLDITVMKALAFQKLPINAPVPKLLFCDIRQATNYQISGGKISLLSGSRVFHYASDRCLTGIEHMMFNGWGADVTYENVTEDHCGRILSESTGIPPKKRRGKTPQNDLALVDLSGNAQSLPDLSLFAVPLVFALQVPGLFKHDLDLATVASLFATSEGTSAVDLDPNMKQRALRAMQHHVQSCSEPKASSDDEVVLSDGSRD